ncbi:MAG TPA: RNA methyltransferase [Candidatus Latescibacteria bacterium]|nr:RNA methyltransferase [Candidatus Latescibacterota bacterium]
MNPWDNIWVVLVEPRHPGNIGAVARAMKNVGLSRLALVRPVPFHTSEAYAMAHMSEEILEEASIYDSLEEALEGKALVVGTTARRGKRRGPFLAVDDAVEEILRTARSNRVALLFGREERGLKNEELKYCQFLVTLPMAYSQPSLNLAQAVLLLGYEIFRARKPPREVYPELASFEELERMYSKIEDALTCIGFIHRNSPKTFMRAVRRVLGRAKLERRDVYVILKICERIEQFSREVLDFRNLRSYFEGAAGNERRGYEKGIAPSVELGMCRTSDSHPPGTGAVPEALAGGGGAEGPKGEGPGSDTEDSRA